MLAVRGPRVGTPAETMPEGVAGICAFVRAALARKAELVGEDIAKVEGPGGIWRVRLAYRNSGKHFDLKVYPPRECQGIRAYNSVTALEKALENVVVAHAPDGHAGAHRGPEGYCMHERDGGSREGLACRDMPQVCDWIGHRPSRRALHPDAEGGAEVEVYGPASGVGGRTETIEWAVMRIQLAARVLFKVRAREVLRRQCIQYARVTAEHNASVEAAKEERARHLFEAAIVSTRMSQRTAPPPLVEYGEVARAARMVALCERRDSIYTAAVGFLACGKQNTPVLTYVGAMPGEMYGTVRRGNAFRGGPETSICAMQTQGVSRGHAALLRGDAARVHAALAKIPGTCAYDLYADSCFVGGVVLTKMRTRAASGTFAPSMYVHKVSTTGAPWLCGAVLELVQGALFKGHTSAPHGYLLLAECYALECVCAPCKGGDALHFQCEVMWPSATVQRFTRCSACISNVAATL